MRARLFLLSLGFSFLAACDTAPPAEGGATDPTDEDRGGLGKADLVGTCELPNGNDRCGGHGVGNCWCDDLCVDYGDCCSDADTVCGIEEPDPEGEPCGGFLGDTCGDDEYCAYEAGQYCGAADASSTCEPRPDLCPAIYMPVCGCDGNTYSNSCDAASAGVGVYSEGECEPPPPGGFCGGIAGIQCPEGQVCVDDGNDDCDPLLGGADCGGVCVLDEPECQPILCELFCENGFATDDDGCEVCSCAEPLDCDPTLICTQALTCVDGDLYPTGCGPANCDEPIGPCGEPEPEPCVVSGCNSEICAAEPMFSPCVALPEFACYDDAQCGHYGPAGECAWQQTEELTSCLDSFE